MHAKHFLLTLFLCGAFSSRAFAQDLSDPSSDVHDWTVLVGYARYGVRGDSMTSFIVYGSGPDRIQVRLPFWAFVTLTSLSVLAIAGSVWRITRRHANAA
jgi:hypothetical protein